MKISSGGGTSSDGSFSMTGTIGQPDPGNMSGDSYSVEGGFWSVVQVVQTEGAPRLGISRSGLNVVLFWPVTATGFVLEQNSSLVQTTAWSGVSQNVVTNNGTNYVTITPSAGNNFFRLKKP
jgi:hypothetical protein